MRVRHYGHAPIPVIGVLAAVAIGAMFSGTRRSGPAGERDRTWWLGAEVAPGPKAAEVAPEPKADEAAPEAKADEAEPKEGAKAPAE